MRAAILLLAAASATAACHPRAPQTTVLPQTAVTDARYQGLVFLVATVRRAGTDFVISNDSTQPWFDVTVALAGDPSSEYRLHLDEIDAGQSITATASQFATDDGRRFAADRDSPRTLIVSAEIGEGGPTGVYAVRL